MPSTFSQRLSCGDRGLDLIIQATLTQPPQFDQLILPLRLKYQWKVKHQWCQLTAQATGPPEPPQEGSLEQFITEHYWGYSTQRSGGSVEYHVSHVPWRVWVSTTAGFEGDASLLYGVELSHVLQGHLSSAFIADGSEVTVFRGNKLA